MPDDKKPRKWTLRRVRRRIESALPHETVSNEYGTRLKWDQFTEDTLAAMPADAKRLHPGEPKWQITLAPKYITNRLALARFLAVAKETDAEEAYLYFPIGASTPNVWYQHNRYTLEDFQERYGKP